MATVPAISLKHRLFYLYLCTLMGRFMLSGCSLLAQAHEPPYFRLDPNMAYYYLLFQYNPLTYLLTCFMPFHGALAHYINYYRTDGQIWDRLYQIVVVNTDSCLRQITTTRRSTPRSRNLARKIYDKLVFHRRSNNDHNNDNNTAKDIITETRFKIKLTFIVGLFQLIYLLVKVMLSK